MLFVFVLFWVVPILAVADSKTATKVSGNAQHDGRDSSPESPLSAAGRNPFGDKRSSPASQDGAAAAEEDCE